jgi:predicted NACHT family NTPase
MPRESLSTSEEGSKKAKTAFIAHKLTQNGLAKELEITRQPVTKFFAGDRIDRKIFVNICERLGLNWQEIANLPQDVEPATSTPIAEVQGSGVIDDLVQKVRLHYQDKIQRLYGKMQLLDISQTVDVELLYVEVNILEQITSQQCLEISDLLKALKPAFDNFEHLGMGKGIQKRESGLEAVKKYPRLMVLGKPGSGKTTFLQHLATQCSEGKFQSDRIPIFIRLKSFAKYARDEGDFRLLNYISREFGSCGISERKVTESLLNHGKGLILLDGLDEVPDENEYEVVEQIRQFSEDYFKNQLIITSRIAASQYRFPGFTEVEIADFNSEQIKSFAQKWFVAVAQHDQKMGKALAGQFIQKLNRSENRQIRELAVTPILLHLTCLVFQTKAEFPSNRAKLYEQGLNILLKKWDEARGIQRDEVYRNLTLPHKKNLLSQVAATTFEQGDYFFEQDKIQKLIADYLRALATPDTDPAQLHLDSEAVLKAIEAQHGLLVERARGIYSFSHLTFQEYFTAKKLVLSLAGAKRALSLQQLGCQITEKCWREVLMLALGMCESADYLLLLMKQQVDELVAADENLQQFLACLNQKSLCVEVSYQPAAVRAFYFCLDRSLDIPLDRVFNRSLSLDSVHDRLDIALDLALEQGLGRALIPALDIALDTTIVPALDTALDIALDIAFDSALVPALDIALVRVLDIALVRAHNSVLVRALKRAFVRAIDPKLRQALQELMKQLPASDGDEERFKQWWQANGQVWTKQLRAVMIEHRNIGHDWQFSARQKKVLTQYYEANKFLVDCHNSGCNVTPTVRQEIEDTLLLPIAEIEKRRSCQNQ